MKKKETTGQEFEKFLESAINIDYKKELTVENVLFELKDIAKELRLELENEKVILEYGKRGGKYNDEIFVELIAPLYFPSPMYKIVINEDGTPIAVSNKEDYSS